MKTPLMWKAELTAVPDGAFSAQFGNLITYHVVSRSYGYLPDGRPPQIAQHATRNNADTTRR